MKVIKVALWIILALIALAASRQWLLPALDNSIYKLLTKNTSQNTGPAPETREQCIAEEGDWGRAGLAPQETCRFPAEDAGKFCLAGFQCRFGKCIGKLELRKPAVFATGSCARYKTTFGCSQEVHFGFTSNAICRD